MRSPFLRVGQQLTRRGPSLNFVRAPRPANVLEAYAVGDDGFMGLPALRPDALEARAALDWWAARLATLGVDAPVRAWAQTELRLNA